MFLLETLNPHNTQVLKTLTESIDPQKPTLLVFSGPSGVGKGVLRKALFTGQSEYGLSYEGTPWQHFQTTISATTRPMREGEKEGVDYYFMNSDDFNQRIRSHDFLEFKSSGSGDMYGTLKSEIERVRHLNLLPVLEIETEGKKEIDQLKSSYNIFSVFILPPANEDKQLRGELFAQVGTALEDNPTLEPLAKALGSPLLASKITTLYVRLNRRNSENTAKRLLRFAKAVDELEEVFHYDIAIVNDTLEQAVPKLRAVFEAVYQSSQTQ